MFSSTSHLISSLARHLGKNILVFLILPGIVQLWCLDIQHPLHPGGIFGQNLPSPCSEKLLNEVEEREVMARKRDVILEWVSNHALTALGMVGCHIVPCDHIYWQVVYQLSPFSGTGLWCIDLLKSHICSRVHFSTQDQPKEVLFYCISYGHAIERVFPKWESAVIYTFA